MAAASHAPKLWEKNALILPKSTIQNAARCRVLKKSIHSEGTTPMSKKLRGPFGPRQTKGSVQGLVAASQDGLYADARVVFFTARRCWQSAMLRYSLGCLSKQQPGAAGPGWQEDQLVNLYESRLKILLDGTQNLCSACCIVYKYDKQVADRIIL